MKSFRETSSKTLYRFFEIYIFWNRSIMASRQNEDKTLNLAEIVKRHWATKSDRHQAYQLFP